MSVIHMVTNKEGCGEMAQSTTRMSIRMYYLWSLGVLYGHSPLRGYYPRHMLYSFLGNLLIGRWDLPRFAPSALTSVMDHV